MNVLHMLGLFSALTTVNGWYVNNCNGCHFYKRVLLRRDLKNGKCDPEKNKICSRTAKDGQKVHMSCLSPCLGHNEDESTRGGHMVAMPMDFNFYDLGSKGCFTLKNLLDAFGTDEKNDPKMREAFELANTNKDACIDRDELPKAPWIFETEEDLAGDTGDQVKFDKEDTERLEKVMSHEKNSEDEQGSKDNPEKADLSQKIRAIKRMLYGNRY